MERALRLYDFLLKNYDEGKYYSKYEICKELSDLYYYDENETRKCRAIEKDVNKINSSGLFNHVIVSNKTGYKIGNKEQVKKYLTKMICRDLRSLVRNKRIQKMVGLDGQLEFDFDNGIIDEFLVYLNGGK